MGLDGQVGVKTRELENVFFFFFLLQGPLPLLFFSGDTTNLHCSVLQASIKETNWVIHRIEIYPGDSVINLLDNLGLFSYTLSSFPVPFGRLQASYGGFHSLKEKLWNKALWSHRGAYNQSKCSLQMITSDEKISPPSLVCSTLGTRGFSRLRREFSVLVEGRSHERRSREKKRADHYKDLTETLTPWHPGYVCSAKFFHTLCAWVFFSTLLLWEFISVKLRNFTISKRGVVMKFNCQA